MKRRILVLIAAVLCVAITVSSACAERVGSRLGFSILRDTYAETENTMVSPVSLTMAVGMLAYGAKGETQQQILDAVGARDVSELNLYPSGGIGMANAVFHKGGIELNADWTEQLSTDFSAEFFMIGNEFVDTVNAWVAEKTNGMIEQMLTEAPSAGIQVMLLNVVTMQQTWQDMFDAEATSDEVFHASKGDLTVPMMHRTGDYFYAETDGIQLIRLPYSYPGLEMWILLPQEDGMGELLDSLALNGIEPYIELAEEKEVILTLPKFDVESEIVLNEPLREAGIDAVFTSDADLSGISDTPLKVDSVVQKVRVIVDEGGTKAAAVTSVGMALMAAPPDPHPAVMRVDHPFVFVIRDRLSWLVYFAGTVVDPA